MELWSEPLFGEDLVRGLMIIQPVLVAFEEGGIDLGEVVEVEEAGEGRLDVRD